jgi:hypothetical protein
VNVLPVCILREILRHDGEHIGCRNIPSLDGFPSADVTDEVEADGIHNPLACTLSPLYHSTHLDPAH